MVDMTAYAHITDWHQVLDDYFVRFGTHPGFDIEGNRNAHVPESIRMLLVEAFDQGREIPPAKVQAVNRILRKR